MSEAKLEDFEKKCQAEADILEAELGTPGQREEEWYLAYLVSPRPLWKWSNEESGFYLGIILPTTTDGWRVPLVKLRRSNIKKTSDEPEK